MRRSLSIACHEVCKTHANSIDLKYYTFSVGSRRLGISRQIDAAKNATWLMGNWLRPEPFFKKKKSHFTQWPALGPFDGSFFWTASDKQVFSNKHAAADAVRHCGKMPFDDVRKNYREKRRPLKRIHLPSEHVYVHFPSRCKPMECGQVHHISKERKSASEAQSVKDERCLMMGNWENKISELLLMCNVWWHG